MDNKENKKVVIIAPHLDDEILGCGGFISKYWNIFDIHVINIARRLSNSKDIAGMESISNRYNIKYTCLNYADEFLDTYGYSNIIKSIEAQINKFNELEYVFIPFGFDINTDHQICNKVSRVVFRQIQSLKVNNLLEYEIPSSTTQSISIFSPNFFIKLEKHNVEEKKEMLLKYDNEVRQYPNPRSLDGIEVYLKFRGMECNNLYAEAFKIIRSIPTV